MTSYEARNRRLLTTAAFVVVAAGAGFGIAKLTIHPAPPPAAAPVAAKGPQSLTLPASYIAAASIGVEAVAAGNLSAEVLAPASVVSAPNGEAVITAHAAGTLVHLAKRLGDPVRAGEVLALVESRDAAAVSADRSVADAKVNLARKVAAREQRLFEQRVSPRQDLEMAQAELAAAEAEARRARSAASAVHVTGDGRAAVSSPLAGRITAQTATLGAFVQPETELFRIADPRLVQIEASVTAADAARISPGDTAVLVTQDGTKLNAVVRSVTPTLNQASRAATVVLTPAGGFPSLTPGSSLQARISPKSAGAGSAIVIPEEAVQSIDGRDVVFVRSAKGFIVQPVTVASRGAGRASVAAGLTAGQSIATRNAFLLKAELNKGGDEGE